MLPLSLNLRPPTLNGVSSMQTQVSLSRCACLFMHDCNKLQEQLAGVAEIVCCLTHMLNGLSKSICPKLLGFHIHTPYSISGEGPQLSDRASESSKINPKHPQVGDKKN